MRKQTHCLQALIVLMMLMTAVGGVSLSQAEQSPKASFMRLPLSFMKNQGQEDPSVLFYERGQGRSTAFSPEGVSLRLAGERITLVPLNAVSPTIEALDKQRGKINYLIGNDPKNWKTDIPTYGAILYKGIYPGVDMKFYGSNSQLEYDLIVSPGAAPSNIRIACRGADKLSLTPDGDLEMDLRGKTLLQTKPRIIQTIKGKKIEVEGRFVLVDATTYGFEVGAYDMSRPLRIDPVLAYSTYLGGNNEDWANAIAVDHSRNIYVTGVTMSPDFPTRNPYQGTIGTYYDVFVTKLNPSGSTLVYSTYLGGDNSDYGQAMAVDSSGRACIAGYTWSTDFPTRNPFQATHRGGNTDAFAAKLNPSGNGLVYSTYLGGDGTDRAFGIAVDTHGSVYVVGETRSSDFPTKDPFQDFSTAGYAAFVTKLDPTGKTLVYSTYLGGGNDTDLAWGIAVNSRGNAYVTGQTHATDFPTKYPFQGPFDATWDAFITKLSASGKQLIYSSYLGGDGNDYGTTVALDSQGNAYVAGYTASVDFPTKNPFQDHKRGGDFDGFVTKVNPSGRAIVYSTYLGGSGVDLPSSMVVDSSGNAYVAGMTDSMDFPTKNPFQLYRNGVSDAFLTVINPFGKALSFSTYLGGGLYDNAYGLAYSPSRYAYLAGMTNSPNFPTKNAYQDESGGGSYDAFITRVSFASWSCGFDTVTLAPLSYPASGEQGDLTVDVSSSRCTWRAVSGAPWIHVTSLRQTGDQTLQVTVDANTTASSRKGIVTVSLTRPPSTRQILHVTQAAQ